MKTDLSLTLVLTSMRLRFHEDSAFDVLAIGFYGMPLRKVARQVTLSEFNAKYSPMTVKNYAISMN